MLDERTQKDEEAKFEIFFLLYSQSQQIKCFFRIILNKLFQIEKSYLDTQLAPTL